MADVQHSALTGANLHEPKGADSASNNTVYVSDGAGSGAWQKAEVDDSTASTNGSVRDVPVADGSNGVAWKQPVRMGWYDYADNATQSTPIALTVANTQYELTNDGAGTYTNTTYKLPEITNIWNTGTDRFDFSGLDVGDTIDLRLDVEFTTGGANVAIDLHLEMDVGGTPFQIPFIQDENKKSAGAYQHIVSLPLYIGSTAVRDNPARVLASADSTGVTVKVNGWFVRAITRNED